MIDNIVNSKFFAGLTATVAFTGVMANAGVASALIKTQVYTDTFGLETTDIKDAVLSLEKFDGSLGTLKSVNIGFGGEIVGDAQVESLDAAAKTLTFDLLGFLDLKNNELSELGTLFDQLTTASDSFDASAFDGVEDYTGTSGSSFEGLTAEVMGEESFTDQTVLDYFTGAGDKANFLFSATTFSTVKGAANIASVIGTKAGASVTVTYEYEEFFGGDVKPERVPEPSSILGLGLFAGAGILSKKKLANKA
ncbi:MAG: PEP-CTERM sorting domain-containing protein [Okeania sp. SIO2F4]|uniref:PEP-CTERM sorting domain-containing protein n=1 Tax=Okeania sp. SIO2F4 TaxID=2607790 RepID=UPI001429C0B4|nr:PEP-CTERM sorting domain-containing protein [Okeania sp. SIO2F4]NES03241.1 PEP-CTERM sorting domain-containing protein [Okeania sp. SIO2F4]